MSVPDIHIHGAREHNLRNVDLVLPRHSLVCLTGVSGSGKSSLAFDTLYAEGQRRYVESLSTFARQFLGQMPKPNVDRIDGLSPSISIAQKTAGQNPRSTVGTITEIYDYLRILYARVGRGYCPDCHLPVSSQTRQQIVEQILEQAGGKQALILAPVVRGQKGEFRDLFADLRKQGYARARVDGEIVKLDDEIPLDRNMRHHVEVVVDRVRIGPSGRARLAEAVENAIRLSEGEVLVVVPGDSETEAGDSGVELRFSSEYACPSCRKSFDPPSPQLFSFNSPEGMCQECNGLGRVHTFAPERLIPDPSRSFQQGCIELLGTWKEMGRWKRHIFRGVAEKLEKDYDLEPGSVLETAWEELPEAIRHKLLWGTGDDHITFTWRAGPSGRKWGGKYGGIIPQLLDRYHSMRSRIHRRYLEKYMDVIACPACGGKRLNRRACAVKLRTASPKFADRPELSLPEVVALAVSDAAEFFAALETDAIGEKIAAEPLKEIRGRLQFLRNVGLDYLTLDRSAPTLSGGEMQRIRLAGQIGCGLVGVLYILDEPSIGLHPRDNDRLLETLARLRDQGNTVVVVEHDEDTMRAADFLVDFGPGPGVRGGEVVAAGPLENILNEKRSVTGRYLAGEREIPVPTQRRTGNGGKLVVRGAAQNNLKNIDVEFPLGTFICVTGVSGSGKSSLVNDILVEVLRRDLNHGNGTPGKHRSIEGLEHLDKMIAIDQSPIGRTPRSNPATYIKLFDEIRRWYAMLPDAKARGYKPGRFSFNVTGGRCEACEGNGATKLEMDFLADVWVTCPVCDGKRFNRETLQVRYRGKSIADVLEMDVQEALEHFEHVPPVVRKLKTLHDVGLDYMKLGQPSPTLSGGEAQRVKLARELVKISTGRTIYLLDEPTTGLHFADIELLLKVLHGFVDAGNTVVVVEHNIDVIKTADWIIDLGPEGGDRGGRIVAAGTPEDVARCPESHTGRVLAKVLAGKTLPASVAPKQPKNGKPKRRRRKTPVHQAIVVRGASEHNLKSIDVKIPRDRMTVCCGPSGSGKSSLAMDTIYAEGQRRYVESLSAYARQFVGQMQKPRIDHIEGLSPAVAIEQKRAGGTPRSTVGTITEIYDYFRILMARLGQPYCPNCDLPIGTQTTDEIVAKVCDHPEGTRLFLASPVEVHVGEKYEDLWDELRASGYARVRIDGRTYSLDEVPTMDRRRRHEVQVIVDRLVIRKDNRARIAQSIETALDLGKGVVHVVYPQDDKPEKHWPVAVHSMHYACDSCGESFEQLSPNNFSFNSPLGWCPACEGLGVQRGENASFLIRNPERSLDEGAVHLWPADRSPLARAMLWAFCREMGIPHDVPFRELDARHRRVIFHGAEGREFVVPRALLKAAEAGSYPTDARVFHATASRNPEVCRFNYEGINTALTNASRMSTRIRAMLGDIMDEVECSLCYGSRLRADAAAVRFRGRTIDGWCRLPLRRLLEEVENWQLDSREQSIAGDVVREIADRTRFLVEVGLDYLTLNRPAPTLSGGESQRIRLAAQVGSGLCGVLYVLDEPTIGLHPRDNRRLLNALKKLRDLGNTLLLVEHDREVIAAADHLLDFGPKAGHAGGEIVAQGPPDVVAKKRKSVTGPYLQGKKAIPIPRNRRMPHLSDSTESAGKAKRKHAAPFVHAKDRARIVPPGGGWLEIHGAAHHNLKGIDVAIPLGTLTAVTGVSGSGKSSLIEDILYQALARQLHRAGTTPGAHDSISGIELINKVIRVDQQPLGQTPTSNPATFTGVFDLIRRLFAQLPEAKMRGFSARRFSFNVPGGRCEKCEGAGYRKIEMHFLPDVWVECDACKGKRYDAETLSVKYHGQSIADVLEMPCALALRLFENIPKIRRILQLLCDVGLGYVRLGQPSNTLSGGEAQRVKLAAELARPDTGKTLYLLDEPTTGLHFEDLSRLLEVLARLVDLGNTVVVIEHNLDVIKTADWVIDLGPEAGTEGGYVVAAGTPEDIRRHADRFRELRDSSEAGKRGKAQIRFLNDARTIAEVPGAGTVFYSYTGEALAPVLDAGPYQERKKYDPELETKRREGDLDIDEVGAEIPMPWETDGRRWHTELRTSRSGEEVRWDGRALAAVVDYIDATDRFSP
ncbi:MAG: excinuclease ABC subunit UvrA, partial [Planctomycetota bacterium]